jgi:hypothetical protein
MRGGSGNGEEGNLWKSNLLLKAHGRISKKKYSMSVVFMRENKSRCLASQRSTNKSDPHLLFGRDCFFQRRRKI